MKSLIQTIVESVVEETMKFPELAADYAKQLNEKSKYESNEFRSFGLSEKQDNWESMGIHSGYDLAHYLATETYITTYKDIYDVKPRHIDFSSLTVDKINSMIDELDEDERLRNKNLDWEAF